MILTIENNHNRRHHQFKEGLELVAMQASDFQQSELLNSISVIYENRSQRAKVLNPTIAGSSPVVVP